MRRICCGAIAGCLLLGALAGVARADLLGQYSFTGCLSTNDAFPVDAQPAAGRFGDYQRGPAVGSPLPVLTSYFVGDDWPLPAAVDTNAWLGFTLTPSPGYVLTITNLTFLDSRTRPGPSNWVLRSSIDGFAADLAASAAPPQTNAFATNALSLGTLTNVAGALSLRFFACYAGAANGQYRQDDVQVYGSFASEGVGPDNPLWFAATTAGTTQVALSWQANAAADPVLIAWSTNGVFGVPAGTYTNDASIAGGGTVLYQGAGTNALHSGLIPARTYYYRAWSVHGATNYGGGVSASAPTLDPSLPLITLVTTNQIVSNAVTSIGITGTANSNVVGTMTWTNSLGGSGSLAASSTWSVASISLLPGYNVITVTGTNAAGIAATGAVGIVRNGAFVADPAVWINEVYYDPIGSDTNEFIELAGAAGTDLSLYSLALYNGATGIMYTNHPLAGAIDHEAGSLGVVAAWVLTNAVLQNGPDGIALVRGGTGVVQFLSYETAFAASNGPAAGLTATDIGVYEINSTGTVQLAGSGIVYSAFTWIGPAQPSPGWVNVNQILPSPYRDWATAYGLGAGTELGDADADGQANLMEYALGTSPTNDASLAGMTAGPGPDGRLWLHFPRSTNAVDVTYLVEATEDLASASWAGINTNIAGTGWSDPSRASESNAGAVAWVSVGDSLPGATNRALRLRVTRP